MPVRMGLLSVCVRVCVLQIVMTANMLQQQAEWEYQMEASCIEVSADTHVGDTHTHTHSSLPHAHTYQTNDMKNGAVSGR